MIKKQFSDNNDNSLIKEILKKFQHIDYLDHEKVIYDLSKIDGVTYQLDYLEEVKRRFHDKIDEVKKSFNHEEEAFWVKNNANILDKLTSTHSFFTLLGIQKPVFEMYFNNGLENPEFTYWFMRYNANILFELEKENSKIEQNIQRPDPLEFLYAEINDLEKFERRASYLINEKIINIDDISVIKEHPEELEFKRLTKDYYNPNNSKLAVSIPDVHSIGNITVQVYAKHFIYKGFIEKTISDLKNSTQEEFKNNNNRPNRTDIAYLIFYLVSTKTLKTENEFPSVIAWKEIGAKYNKNWKNIQQVFNDIQHYESKRITKSRIKNIEYVIDIMLDSNSLASQLANNELKKAQLKL